VLLQIDGEQADGPALLKQYSVPGYPTFILMNAKGQTLSRWSGYDRTQWLASTDQTLKDPTTMDVKVARFQKAPTERDALTIARYQDSKGQYALAIDHYKKAAELSGGKSTYGSEIFDATFTGFEDKTFTVDDVVTSANALFAAAKDPGELLVPARMMTYAGSESGKPEIAVPFVKTAIERTENVTDADALKQRKRLLPDYALIVLKDTDKAISYKKESLGEGWTDRPSDLNNFAWWCFENKINTDEAYAMATRGSQLAKPGPDRAQILDTMAELCNVKNDCNGAVKLIQQAIQDDPKNRHYGEQLKRFQALAEQQGK
jgi:tetratricopeptide (TPR) repeat protein